MTALPPCPACGRDDTTKSLADVTLISSVKYYRCEACPHVWVTFADGEVHHVTPLVKVERAT